MGYDPSRFNGPVDDELKCPICCFVLQDAVQAPDCEHTFCDGCITEWLTRQSNCPVDRSPLTKQVLKPAPRVLRNLLAKLDIKCDFASGGCPAIVKLELLQSHMDSCDFNPYKPVICEKGCGFVLLRNQVEGHNCLSDLRELISKQESQIVELKAAKASQAEQISELKGNLKRLQEQELVEHQKQVYSISQQVQRMQALLEVLQQKQQAQHQIIVQQQQMMASSLERENDADTELSCDCENCEPTPPSRACLYQQPSPSTSIIPRKRMHSSWKGKDFPAKRISTASTSTGGKPCHAYGLSDVHERSAPSPYSGRSAPSPFSETEIMRHNYYHTNHGHNHHSHNPPNVQSPASPDETNGSTTSSSPGTPRNNIHYQHVTFYGEVITLNLSEDEFVEDVKGKIERKEGIPADQQLLFFAGQQLEDEKPLTYYQIFNSTASETSRHLVLRLKDGMKIYVKTLSDKTIEVQVDPNETIEIVKVKIHEQEGISPCDQRLLQDGRDLGDLRTLADYGIKHKSTLQLDLHLGGPCPICQSQFKNSGSSSSATSPTRVSSGKGAGHFGAHSSSSLLALPAPPSSSTSATSTATTSTSSSTTSTSTMTS